MISKKNYEIFNLRLLLDENSSQYMGVESVRKLLAHFTCPNKDVERFLHCNAIEFTQKSQSVTYLVIDTNTSAIAVFFALAIKPLSIDVAKLPSKTAAKKLARVSILDQTTQTYTTAAYLLAQFGKNFSLPLEERIKGNDLLDFALEMIIRGKHSFGGMVCFLECEDVPRILDFYADNGFTPFDSRMTEHADGEEPYLLRQLLRFI